MLTGGQRTHGRPDGRPGNINSGVVANLELWEVLFPSFPFHSFLSPHLLSPPSPSPPLPYLVAIISMIFLRINLPYTLHFFASLPRGTLLYHRSPLSCYHLGERRSPQNIWGERRFPAFPLDYSTGYDSVLIAQISLVAATTSNTL